jgi:hypothetical protein
VLLLLRGYGVTLMRLIGGAYIGFSGLSGGLQFGDALDETSYYPSKFGAGGSFRFELLL